MEPPAPGPAHDAARLPWGLAWRLALGQMLAWGVLYYAFSVVIGPMQLATGWTRPFLNGGLSLGLLVWGLCALPVGAWIQRQGGRTVMSGASLLGGAALVLMGSVPHPGAYFTAWVLLGTAMAGLLYEPAFAVVTAAFGPQYRRGITLITLLAGLASTVFIPLAHLAVSRLGWGSALVYLGLAHICIGVPLHWLGVPAGGSQLPPSPTQAAMASVPERLREWLAVLAQDIREPRFRGLALWFISHIATFSGVSFLLVPMYQSLAVDMTTLLTAIALIGPMQVAGRLLLTARGGEFQVLVVGRWAMAALAGSVLILLMLPPTALWLMLFAGLYGIGNGIMTILKGTAVAELFGRERYAELNGALSTPAVLARAGAPLLLSLLWTHSGNPRAVLLGILVILAAGVLGLELTRQANKQQLHKTSV